MGIIIDAYSFGRIRIAGKEYTSDVIIYPDRVDASWWRRDGHYLVPEDLAEVFLAAPAMLVIGTGYHGRMEIPAETLECIRGRGIQVIAGNTKDAVELLRLRQEDNDVVAALHLTC
jgi:hypothetical protein